MTAPDPASPDPASPDPAGPHLIVGCGYLGRRVAARWHAAGRRVACLTRSPETAAAFEANGWEAVVGDVTDADSLAALPTPAVVLHAVGYDRRSDATRADVAAAGTANVLASPAGGAGRYLYVSTTGVMAQSDGQWVDEDSPAEPDGESGRANLAAERAVLNHFADRPGGAVVLRPSGIYGPGRVMRSAEQVRSGEPVVGRGEAWLNLVHVDDLAAAVLLAADAPAPAERYLVSDDRPLTRRAYYTLLADRFGGPPPTFTGEGGRVDGLGKRCRNDRAKRDLGWSPRFPTAAEGLDDALRG